MIRPPSMRVAYVLKRFPRFSETFILNELLELERQGVDVEIFSLLRPPGEPRHALLSQLKARVIYLPSGSVVDSLTVKQCIGGGDAEHIPLAIAAENGTFDDAMPGKDGRETSAIVLKAGALALIAKARGIGHFHAHFGSDATTVAMLASRLSGIAYSFTAHAKDIYHTYINEKVDRRMRMAKIAEAAFVTTVSEFNRKHLIGLAGPLFMPKIRRLYNGIDLDRFTYMPHGRDPATILTVGRLVEKKGIKDLVAACAILRDRKTDFKCMIVGEGPLQGSLAAQITENNLEKHVFLVGPKPQEDLIELMRRATVFVLPCIVTESGDRDGLPTVLLEALASGLPAISTDVSGVPEIIEHGTMGLIARQSAPNEIATAMSHLLDSPSLRQRMAEVGRKKAEADFDLVKNVAVLRRFFETSGVSELGGADEHRLRVG
jgi:colanic acid/amylovoran biosynthesis glycosyltransferase